MRGGRRCARTTSIRSARTSAASSTRSSGVNARISSGPLTRDRTVITLPFYRPARQGLAAQSLAITAASYVHGLRASNHYRNTRAMGFTHPHLPRGHPPPGTGGGSYGSPLRFGEGLGEGSSEPSTDSTIDAVRWMTFAGNEATDSGRDQAGGQKKVRGRRFRPPLVSGCHRVLAGALPGDTHKTT